MKRKAMSKIQEARKIVEDHSKLISLHSRLIQIIESIDAGCAWTDYECEELGNIISKCNPSVLLYIRDDIIAQIKEYELEE
jgi:hypothetical protein